MKKILFNIFIVFCVLISSINVFAADSFVINLAYSLKGQSLIVDLERVSRDEVKDFMQKLVVQKSDVTIEESMINQNYLNEIKKVIPIKAEAGEEIIVKLHYGKDKIFEKSILVTAVDLPKEEMDRVNNEVRKQNEVEIEVKKAPSYGYEVEKPKGVERADFGYSGDESPYGYSIKENPAYKSDFLGFDPDDPENKKSYGYKDPGKEDVGQKGFGYSTEEHISNDRQFGRESYESDPLWNKR